MAKFQYYINDFTDEEMTMDNLNAWGENGWEMVSNEVFFKEGRDVNRVVFKCEILDVGVRKVQYYITDFKEAEMTADGLNVWGENGWELVSSEVVFVKGDTEDEDIYHLIFKAVVIEEAVA